MKYPLVKICGITNAADARLATKLVADIIGFIFSKSRRKISARKAAVISKKIQTEALFSGVFVNETPEFVNRTVKKALLDIVQLHGNETPGYIGKIKSASVVKVLKVSAGPGLGLSKLKIVKCIRKQMSDYKAADAFLLDTATGGKSGGTGKVFDWKILKLLGDTENKPVYIAGGITPLNVRKLVKEYGPYGIDVSSGVELKPGKKSPVKLRKLFEKIYSR